MTGKGQELSGLRVFVVEDEFAVLMLVEDMLSELGCELVGTAARLQEAMTAAETIECDVAILDVNINGQNVAPVVDLLTGRGTPFVFSTGYGKSGIDGRFRERPVLQKPYRIEDFAEALRQALSGRNQTRSGIAG